MVLDPAWNWAVGTLVGTYSDSATTFNLATGEGARFPDPATVGAYNCVVWLASTYPSIYDDPNREIVRVTAKSGDTLTVVRGQETAYGGLAASTKDVAGGTYRIGMAPTAKLREDISAAAVDIGNLTVYVSETGAIGDGVADDTAAIQEAIDNGNDIVFPPGTYLISDNLVLKSNLRLRGAGIGITTIKFKNSVSGSKSMLVDPGSAISRVTIQDLTLDGNAANNSTTLDGIRINGLSLFVFRNLEIIEQRGNGISLGVASGTTTQGNIDSCIVYRARSHCIEIQNRNNNNVAIALSNLKLIYPGYNGGSGKAALSLSGRANVSNTHLEDIRDNNYGLLLLGDDGTKGAGAHNARVANVTIHGAVHASNVSIGMYIAADGCAVSNCYVQSCDRGFELQGDDNVLQGCRSVGSDFGVVVAGDNNKILASFIDGGITGILLTSDDETTIRDCHLDGSASAVEVGSATNIHAKNNQGWKTHARVISSGLTGGSPADGTHTIAHGLDVTPAVENCIAGVVVTAGDPNTEGDWRMSQLMVLSADATNIGVRFFLNVQDADITWKAIIDVDVYP